MTEGRHFLRWSVLIGGGAFAVVWLYVALAPLAFLDPEYAAWAAKAHFLTTCNLGDVVIAGDSRAAADIQPALLKTPTTNLALGGGEPIEAFAVLRRAMACPKPPRRVIISFGIGHFVRPDLFWQRSVAYGFLDFADLEELRLASASLNDESIYRMQLPDGLAPRLRAALYAVRFPSLYFGNLLHGGVFLRLPENLAMLAARGVEVDFVSTPMNETTWHSVRPAVAEAFATYLREYAQRYPNLHIVGPLLPHWPDRYFGDSFSHLNPEGSALFSRAFAAWLSGKTPDAPPDLRAASTPTTPARSKTKPAGSET